MKISIIANPRKKKIYSVCRKLIPWLKRKGVEVFISKDIAREIKGAKKEYSREEAARKGDILIALGGDGTLLEAVRLLKGRDIPIIGVNAGGLGFLTEVTLEEFYPLLENVLKGKFETKERAMLEVSLGSAKKFFALNDVVITRGAFSRILRLNVYIENEFANAYLSDGLILATPTGSTAHSLSAGGPIVHPELKVIVLSPICPHTMTNRPLIIPGDKEITIELDREKVEVSLTVDGQIWKSLAQGQKVKIKMAKNVVRLITNPEKSYFEVLRRKLNWKGTTGK
ncbi:MAG: NAD(+)/NADH kinase [Candidatus Omnitrophica bacterium]|nr:NAD(+)/NADH kinase [Candidatus Omnitrophota bacterium]